MALILPILGWFLIVATRSTRMTWRAYLAVAVGSAAIVCSYAVYYFFVTGLNVPASKS